MSDIDLINEIRILKKEIIQIRESIVDIQHSLNKMNGKNLLKRSYSTNNLHNYANEKFLTMSPKDNVKRRSTDSSVKYLIPDYDSKK